MIPTMINQANINTKAIEVRVVFVTLSTVSPLKASSTEPTLTSWLPTLAFIGELTDGILDLSALS